MPKLQLDRRNREAALMAVIGLFAIFCLRFPIEFGSMLLMEMAVIVVSFCALVLFQSRGNKVTIALTIVLLLAPVASSFLGRRFGSAIAFELTGLTAFGTLALALAVMKQNRARSMSLVASGFLTLFGTVISDEQYAVWIAILWITVCVWHLVANHWERIDLCSADHITRSRSIRPLTVAAATLLFVFGGLIAKDRFGESSRLHAGFMPTSGGSEWSDPGATHGIGTGDAAVAGKDQAESFGAVESDLFLESTDSTLFDMFSDSIGQPKKKNKWERRQGMTSEKVIEAHSHTARSDKGSSSFSTDRHPPKKHRHLKDVAKNALVQWVGPTGIRLAMNRHDTFDGVDWTNEADYQELNFRRAELGDQVWFFEPKTANQLLESDAKDIARGKLKVIRLETTRIPVPMLTSGVHIKDIDRPDFFAVHKDGSFFMPGREKVPALTVVNIASLRVVEDEVISRVNERRPAKSKPSHESVDAEISRLVQSWTAEHSTRYAKLQAILQRLRTDFEFDRYAEFESEFQILEFLKNRRGGDHLFATAATLMAREIGLRSRFVTGLYVRPSAVDIAAGHTNVLPDDVHAWAEIQLDDGRWIEIEPTPGFREPVYKASLWLISQRFAAQYWLHGLVVMSIITLVYVTRLIWLECLLTSLWWASIVISPKRRLSLAVRIIETRAKLLGHSRPAGAPPREWLLGKVARKDVSDSSLRSLVESFCDLADRLYFGNSETELVGPPQIQIANSLVGSLPMRRLKNTLAENQS